jgi:hypothetical protein
MIKVIILILLFVMIYYLVNNKKEDLSLLNTNRNSLRLDNTNKNMKSDNSNKNMRSDNSNKNMRSDNSNKNMRSDLNLKNAERKLVEKNQDYDELLERNDEDLVYFQNDFINQSKITEDAYDIVNCIDKVDYGDVTTGMDKCEKSCGGVCLELGYTGVASCFPKADKPFDWGTLYKNPTFTYGLTQNEQEPYFKGNFNYQF